MTQSRRKWDATVAHDGSLAVGRVRAEVEGLHHVHGRMLVRVQGSPVGTLEVDDGRAVFLPGDGTGDVEVDFDDGEDIGRMLRGELHPVVAGLQRRMRVMGDLCLGAKILLGLRTGIIFEPAPK